MKQIFYPQDTVKIDDEYVKSIFPWAWEEMEKVKERNKRAPKDKNRPDG